MILQPWLAVSLALVMMSHVNCTRRGFGPGSAKAPSVLSLQLSSEPVSLDPSLAEDGVSLRILYNTFEGLVGYDGAGTLHNRMADSYQVSKGGLIYDFVLRKEARWSDGKVVTAADFVTGLRRSLQSSSGSKLAGSLLPIRGAQALLAGKGRPEDLGVRDEGGHLIIELEEPTPNFAQALALPVASPLRADVLSATGGKWPDLGPSTGPYRIESHDPDRVVRLVLNPYYWNKEASQKSPPNIELLVVPDESTGLTLFEQGRLDILTKIGSADFKRLHPGGLLHTDPFLATFYLSFNMKKPPFNDRDWRRAVAGAIQREELVSVVGTGETPARSWIPIGLEGFIRYADPAPLYAGSLAKVKQKPKLKGTITMGFDTSHRNSLIMQKVQHDLETHLGLRLSLMNMDWKSYLKMLQTDPPPLFRLGILSPLMDPIQILGSFTTGDPNNYLKWSNLRYDRLVRKIRTLSAGAERTALIQEAQHVLVDEEAIVVPLFHYVQNHLVAQRVRGFRVNPFGVIRFDELRLE